MPKEIRPLTTDELPAALKVAFAELYALDDKIAELKAEHIDPLADSRTATWRDLKAKTDIARKDLDLFYKLYKRARMAQALDDEAEGERIRDNLRRVYQALQAGETLDWLDAVNEGRPDTIGGGSADAPAVAAADDDDMFEVAPAEVFAPDSPAKKGRGKKAKDPEPDPAADWDGTDRSAGSDDEMDGAGFTFAAGRQAAIDGEDRGANPHPETVASHGLWDKGWVRGNDERDEPLPPLAAEAAAATAQTH